MIYYVSDLYSQFFCFQLGTCFSIYGCLLKQNEFRGRTVNGASLDAVSTFMVPTLDGVLDIPELTKNPHQEFHVRKIAGVWGYIFQIIYQVIFGPVHQNSLILFAN